MQQALQLYASNRKDGETLTAMVRRLHSEGHTVYTSRGHVMNGLSLAAHVGSMATFQIEIKAAIGQSTSMVAFGYGGPALVKASDLTHVCGYCNEAALEVVDASDNPIQICSSCGGTDFLPADKERRSKEDLLASMKKSQKSVDFKG